MKSFTVGQRITLLYSVETVRAGALGTVREVHPDQDSVVADWDNGPTATAHPATDLGAVTSSWVPAAGTGLTWPQTLQAVRAAGNQAGREAADQWCRATIGENATSDPKPAARNALLDIAGESPELIVGLPLYHRAGRDAVEPPTDSDLVTLMDGPHLPTHWNISDDCCNEATDAYQDAFDTGLVEHVAEQCRLVASPTGDGRDLSHLGAKDIRLGRAGVFSGHWHATTDDGPDRYRIGFAGVLVDWWNGWAVFDCTREVADRIVADLDATREQERQDWWRRGLRRRADLNRAVDETLARVWFDRDVLVMDQRGMSRDPQAIERGTAAADGRWIVMGRNWTWQAVDPHDCDHIAGDLPATGDEQVWTLLWHTPGLRVPHDRLRITPAGTITLALDGEPVAVTDHHGDGSRLRFLRDDLFGPQDWATYLTESRYQDGPVSEARLLTALLIEAELGQRITAREPGTTLVRLLDDAGHTIETRPVPVAPRDWDAVRALAVTLPDERAGTRWQVWVSHGWLALTPTGPNPSPDTAPTQQ
ncbi:hypothetical protein [Paractinoplanes durhamensis]|uniref:Uncharacterized protein n=1 Tax=Paractinoplanes durhamensis TaxID=113563 RepID=A0ABQ3Z0T0_9ACTN|nr:hypothetical protein [Actinoplanes durhamensis]GIE03423.1 hypothetical protein Adu01nite_47730 [Actinoplanes durhamensis]